MTHGIAGRRRDGNDFETTRFIWVSWSDDVMKRPTRKRKEEKWVEWWRNERDGHCACAQTAVPAPVSANPEKLSTSDTKNAWRAGKPPPVVVRQFYRERTMGIFSFLSNTHTYTHTRTLFSRIEITLWREFCIIIYYTYRFCDNYYSKIVIFHLILYYCKPLNGRVPNP